ncbi:hypothetical protein [Cohaesibacter celericrescens]|uniref:Uncharacterized protein n=1 Tax=Cohaesibacter celericrescens TaxID=2067669 RepID=A0A2N5XPJ5_9HYPH|nr:hypothetical protein [Cohaesibacter celericrescens]PLW76449.1 hypothetical protein C0081_16390 [Cohaesibacter celericrescens]
MVKPEDDMTIEHFETLLDLYGSDLSVWPVLEGGVAKRLLENSQTARNSLQMSINIAKLIEAQPPLKAPASLIQRIMDKAKKPS